MIIQKYSFLRTLPSNIVCEALQYRREELRRLNGFDHDHISLQDAEELDDDELVAEQEELSTYSLYNNRLNYLDIFFTSNGLSVEDNYNFTTRSSSDLKEQHTEHEPTLSTINKGNEHIPLHWNIIEHKDHANWLQEDLIFLRC